MYQHIYHEKQKLWMCALHTFNNLLQKKVGNKRMFQNYAEDISKNYKIPQSQLSGRFFGGDYDYMVLEKAFKQQGKIMQKHCNLKLQPQLEGFVINIQSKSLLGWLGQKIGIGSKNHWYAVTRIQSLFYEIDSSKDEPVPISSIQKYIQQLIRDGAIVFDIKAVNEII